MKLRTEKINNSEYPKTLELRDQREVLVRPLTAADEEALLAFYRELPPETRLRLRPPASGVVGVDRVLPGLPAVAGEACCSRSGACGC